MNALTINLATAPRLHRPLNDAPPFHSTNTAGVRGVISRYVTTLSTSTTTMHVYEMDVASLDDQWLEAHERRREWVDYPTALARLSWKPEFVQALNLSTLASSGR